MAIQERVPMTAAEQQRKEFNEASAQVKRASYAPPADTAWCIIGCVLAEVVTPTQADEVLPPLMGDLAVVTSCMVDRFFMATPATIETADTQFDLHCSHVLTGTEVFVGEGSQSYMQKGHKVFSAIPVSTTVAVYVLRLPAVLDGPGRATLETAIEALAGVLNCEVLLSGAVPANVTGAALALEVRYRNDAVPVEV